MEFLGAGRFGKASMEGRHLGVSTFTASLHSVESCGSDGLPLTPNSIKILGRFEFLKTLSHPNLCLYVDMTRGKHERLMCVAETYKTSLKTCLDAGVLGPRVPAEAKLRLVYEVAAGIEFLHSRGILHRNLKPGNVLLDAGGRVKLSDYGLFHVTDHGCLVSFPVGSLKYFAPEVLAMGFKPAEPKYSQMTSSMADSWSIGMLALEVFHGREVLARMGVQDTFKKILGHARSALASARRSPVEGAGDTAGCVGDVPSASLFDELVEHEKGLKASVENMSADLRLFIRSCLTVLPDVRPEVECLVNSELFSSVGGKVASRTRDLFSSRERRSFLPVRSAIPEDPSSSSSSSETETTFLDFVHNPEHRDVRRELRTLLAAGDGGAEEVLDDEDDFPSPDVRSVSSLRIGAGSGSKVDHLARRTPGEVYHLWQLAGGDLEAELRRMGLIRTKPPILSLPRLGLLEGEMFGMERDRNRAFVDTVVILSMDQLKTRLANVPPEAYYPLMDEIEKGSGPSSESMKEALKLPLVIREKDVEYQLHRLITSSRLLEGYPYTRSLVIKEARKDISPLYRAEIWAALLDVIGDVDSEYISVDKETPTPTDRQIEVDIPRCHQYDELLASPTGHKKFKRILKAWVASHPQYVYWQGLDSLCAPFLRLNFSDEALAYACLSSFIDKYLAGFFLKDNSPVIQEYLATFSHLVAFHDPQLFNHLDEIGFIPELYAIPWFLTMYTHVFPLPKIMHLWDTLLLGPPSFPLCVGVGLLHQLRDSLLSFTFNDCILLFSDMPQIDIERCVQDSIRFFCSTPPSVLFRRHEVRIPSKQIGENLVDDLPEMVLGSSHKSEPLDLTKDFNITPLPLAVLKKEKCPQISGRDLLDMLNLRVSTPDSPSQPSEIHMSAETKAKVLPLDVRTKEEYSKGSVPGSINIPYQTAFDVDGQLIRCPEAEKLVAAKGKIIVVIGNRGSVAAVQTAEQLVKLELTRVCVLHKGIESLRTSSILVVPHIG